MVSSIPNPRNSPKNRSARDVSLLGATMTFWEAFLLVLAAGLAGGLAKSLIGFSRGGCVGAILFGFVGALVGRWLSRQLELPDLWEIPVGDRAFPVLWSIVGAMLFVAVLSLLARRPAVR